MEKRAFGSTGFQTTILGFGGFHLLEIPLSEAEYLLNQYLDAGGNYIETAANYGNGESERKIGLSVSRRRDDFFLTTKTSARTKDGCLASLERSLENLNTDHVDLLIMHSPSVSELEILLGPGGAIEAALQAKEQGKIKHIGVSMHGQPEVLIRALNEYPFDAVMSTVNFFDRCNFPEIEDTLIPLAQEKKAALIIMKPIADGLLWKEAETAFRYAFSRPASVVVTGMNSREMLEADLRYAESFVPMSDEEIDSLLRDSRILGDYVCRQCGKCLPCPERVPITEIFKCEGYFDRQMMNGAISNVEEYALKERLRFWFGNKDLALRNYEALPVKADSCTGCGACLPRCPYGIDIIRKLDLIDYKFGKKDIF